MNAEVKTNVNINGELPDAEGIVHQSLTFLSTIYALLTFGGVLFIALYWIFFQCSSIELGTILIGAAVEAIMFIISAAIYIWKILKLTNALTISVRIPDSSSNGNNSTKTDQNPAASSSDDKATSKNEVAV